MSEMTDSRTGRGSLGRPKRCNLSAYLLEQELACRRMERVTHADTRDGKAWGKVAKVIYDLRIEHCEQCGKCE
jgi:hypothetical protein